MSTPWYVDPIFIPPSSFERFGLVLQAPGEAEAELAAMNRADHIDAVVTNDIDTFLFGGLTVIRTYVHELPDAMPST